jgi:phenylacetate-CoA ligase
VEGRIDDVLFTVDGRLIGRLDPVFKGDLPIREAQIIQESLTEIRVRYVPATGFDSEAERSLIEELRARLGMVEVVLEPVQDVPRGPNGKFKAVINNISAIKRHDNSLR